MVRLFINTHIFELPWISVTQAWISKYPNTHSLQVEQVDTISRAFDEDGVLIIRRLISVSPMRTSYATFTINDGLTHYLPFISYQAPDLRHLNGWN